LKTSKKKKAKEVKKARETNMMKTYTHCMKKEVELIRSELKSLADNVIFAEMSYSKNTSSEHIAHLGYRIKSGVPEDTAKKIREIIVNKATELQIPIISEF
jgi:hypothetical protein